MNPCWDSVAATAIGGAKKQTIFKRSSQLVDNYIDDDDENFAGPPEFKSDFGTAIAVALEKQMFNQPDTGSSDSKTKKKKKQRKTVLFSTGLPGRSFMGN